MSPHGRARAAGLAGPLFAAAALTAAVPPASADGTPPQRYPPGSIQMESQDRDVPRPKPVTAAGVRYEVVRNARMRGFDQAGGVVEAVDAKTKASLWTLQVYTVRFDPQEERDVQEVFITSLAVDAAGKRLKVTNERKETYVIDTATREVSRAASR